jgi:hypothetical protein
MQTREASLHSIDCRHVLVQLIGVSKRYKSFALARLLRGATFWCVACTAVFHSGNAVQ